MDMGLTRSFRSRRRTMDCQRQL